jgi:hypothetical protein
MGAVVLRGSVVVNPDLRVLRHEPPPVESDVAAHVLRNNCIPAGASGVVASKRLVCEVGQFDPAFSSLADWDLWIRLGQAAPIATVARPLVAYRVDPRGMAHDVTRMEHELDAITAKYANQRAQRNVTTDWKTWHRYFARLHLRRGDQRAAAHRYALADRAGAPTRYGVAALCLVKPHLSEWADRLGRLRVPRGWRKEAEVWLAELAADEPDASRR